MALMDPLDPRLFANVLVRCEAFGKVYSTLSNKDRLARISKQDVLVRSTLNDLMVVWARFLDARQRLTALASMLPLDEDAAARMVAGERSRLISMQNNYRSHLRVDVKSLFLFCDILLNRVALLVQAVLGSRRHVRYKSFSEFIKSLRRIEDHGTVERALYNIVGKDLEKVDVQVGFFRDKFVAHLLGAYQESLITGVYHPEVRIDYTSWRLEEFDQERFNKLIGELGNILPSEDKYGDPLTGPGDPRLKVEVLFEMLHRIPDEELRQRAEGFVRSIGMSSPDIYTMVRLVSETTIKMIDFLENQLIESSTTG